MAEEIPLCFCFSSDFSTLCTKITHEIFMRFLHKLNYFCFKGDVGAEVRRGCLGRVA